MSYQTPIIPIKILYWQIAFILLILGVIGFTISVLGGWSYTNYISLQQTLFYRENLFLSQFPNLEYNFTQIGDTLVFLSLCSLCVFYAPKVWQNLLVAFLFCLIFSAVLKSLFAVPRPAAYLPQDSFHIIGKTLVAHTSLPSGHSITILCGICVLIFGFLPKKNWQRLIWFFSMLSIGFFLCQSRVALGAHYPLDTIIGGLIGYICGILGIIMVEKFSIISILTSTKTYLFWVLCFILGCIALIFRILEDNLVIYYIAIAVLLFSLFKILRFYVEKRV